jgi:MaoC like domain/short chain dehydrogenase
MRIFTHDDQVKFALLSFDYNPMHMDVLAARRTQAGALVVRGIHALLWVLDELACAKVALNRVCQIRAQFTKFIYVGAELEIMEGSSGDGIRRFSVTNQGVSLLKVTIREGEKQPNQPAKANWPTLALRKTPAEPSLADIADQGGWLPPTPSANSFRTAFPNASRMLDCRRLQTIAQLSYLVGMVCPGLHSILTKVELDILATVSGRGGLGFSSSRDERFRLVDLRIRGPGAAGTVSAFVRYPPIEPRSLAEISTAVEPTEFARVRALIVGGSRGLGATTAKIIAAGGGRVIITYARGRMDAENIAQEINSSGTDDRCEVLPLDVYDSAQLDLSRLRGEVTELYYFATPQISNQQAESFSPSIFSRFIHAYVSAFAAICTSLIGDRRLSVFYPSSTFVEQRPQGMTEYAMAKASGEILCADLNTGSKNIVFKVARLPRILTDQTAAVPAANVADALLTMLPIVRSMPARQVSP